MSPRAQVPKGSKLRFIAGRKMTVQHQYRKCNKVSCRKCSSGPGHGPYWYGMGRNEDGKQYSFYIGKKLPED